MLQIEKTRTCCVQLVEEPHVTWAGRAKCAITTGGLSGGLWHKPKVPSLLHSYCGTFQKTSLGVGMEVFFNFRKFAPSIWGLTTSMGTPWVHKKFKLPLELKFNIPKFTKQNYRHHHIFGAWILTFFAWKILIFA